MLTAQAVMFCGGLLFAAVYDICKREVSDGVCLLIALSGLSTAGISSIFGEFIGAATFYIGAGNGKNGAGDIMLCATAGLVLGFVRTIAGLWLFSVLFGIYVLGDALIAKLRHRPGIKSCPLVPFIAAGFIAAYFFA